ncbi:ABC transporter ATP-binding protein [Sedimenticola sp.]|uniref:ABC transporter ATP-binding protein n=2 Tax=Sedimenticola sp. TaxID=1940285 RepID=UPI003D0ABBAC
MAALIHIENLSRHYGDYCAVAGVSFDLQPGEILGFLGPNGAGKSTTMQIISGVLAASSGRVQLDGYDLHAEPIKAKRRLGYLPEVPPLYPDMQVDEYLSYCARLHRITRSEVAQAVARAKERCGLSAMGARVIGNLSKGYQQRVGIAQAIIHNPRIIILDEPTSGLDPNQVQEIRRLIQGLAEESGILLSTHILPEVQSLCDRVLILHQGRLVYAGPVSQQQQDRVLVSLATDNSDTRLLETLPGVRQVEPLGPQQYRLTLDGHHSPADIAEAIVKQGGRLAELRSDQDDLERIFSQVTLGEQIQ